MPRVLKDGEIIAKGRHAKGELVFLKRLEVDGNWMYAGEALRGSHQPHQMRDISLQLKTLYWLPKK